MNFNELPAGNAQQAALLQHFRQLDKFAWRMELLPHDDSMVEHLFTEERGEIIGTATDAAELHADVIEKQEDGADTDAASTVATEGEQMAEAEAEGGQEKQQLYAALAEMADRLEQHVAWVMSAMNRWCLTVLGWEILLLGLVAGAVGGIAYLIGGGQPLPVLQGWWHELLTRPISLTVYAVLILLVAFLVHFRLRRHVAAAIVARLDMVHPFDTQRAFLKNTRIWHSIFRPQPKGWARKAERKLNEIRKELTDNAVHAETSESSAKD